MEVEMKTLSRSIRPSLLSTIFVVMIVLNLHVAVSSESGDSERPKDDSSNREIGPPPMAPSANVASVRNRELQSKGKAATQALPLRFAESVLETQSRIRKMQEIHNGRQIRLDDLPPGSRKRIESRLENSKPSSSLLAGAFIVTSTGDEIDSDLSDDIVDPPTLRAAIENVNAGKISAIGFSSDLTIIYPLTVLPEIVHACYIDGSVGIGGKIIIDGSNVAQSDIADFPGFWFAGSDTSWIVNVEIRSFPDGGIVNNTSMLYVQGCSIHDNNEGGIIGFSGDIMIGGDAASEGNQIYNNFDTTYTGFASNGEGIYLNQCSATIINNLIGVRDDGFGGTAAGNKFGIRFDGTGFNDVLYNVISANLYAGFTSPDYSWGGGNMIYGNYIGTDADGAFGLGAQGYDYGGAGIWLTGSQEVFPDTIWDNLISGNDYDGIDISFSNGHIIVGNYIGVDLNGEQTLPNGKSGIYLSGEKFDVFNNLIAGNEWPGLYGSNVDSSWIHENWFGIGTGGVPLFSPDDNIAIYHSTGTYIESNYICGSDYHGIYLSSSNCYGNTIRYNWIGTNSAGDSTHGNDIGVFLYNGPYDNEIRNNVVAGNRVGIVLQSSSNPASANPCYNNIIAGNLVGLLPDSLSDGGNVEDGIVLMGAELNTVGGPDKADRNYIGFNGWDGVRLLDQSTDNQVFNNVIGLNAHGDNAHNYIHGISIENSTNNVIGSSDPAPAPSEVTKVNPSAASSILGNVISSNDSRGILVWSDDADGSSGNVILGNWIGLDLTGTKVMPNGSAAIELYGTKQVLVGDPLLSLPNVIVGHDSAAVLITGPNSQQNTVQNNIIGLSPDLSIAMGNLKGIEIVDSEINSIGDTQTDGPGLPKGNVIAANDTGIVIRSTAFAPADLSTFVISNQIGADTPNDWVGNSVGIAAVNVGGIDIGGDFDTQGNDFVNNTQAVLLDKGSTVITITGNSFRYGAQQAINIKDANIVVIGDASLTQNPPYQLRNIFYDNDRAITASWLSYGINILINKFMDNGLGIDLNDDGVTFNDTLDADTGANDLLNMPVLEKVFLNAGNDIDVDGWYSGEPNTTLDLLFYANEDYSNWGYGEGEDYIGVKQVTTDANGFVAFSATFPTPSILQQGEYVTAVAHNETRTSEFSGALLWPELDWVALAAALQAAPDTVAAGDPIRLSATLTNTSDTDANTVMITDTLDALLEYIDASTSRGTVSHADGVVNFDIGSLQAGQSVSVHLTLGATGMGEVSHAPRVISDPPLLRPAAASLAQHFILLGITGSAEPATAQLPKRYEIQSIYPNPFNPTATIVVALPERAQLSVDVFNLLGQRVVTLAEGEYSAGARKFTLDGSSLASGVYFVRARVPGRMNQLRRVALVK